MSLSPYSLSEPVDLPSKNMGLWIGLCGGWYAVAESVYLWGLSLEKGLYKNLFVWLVIASQLALLPFHYFASDFTVHNQNLDTL